MDVFLSSGERGAPTCRGGGCGSTKVIARKEMRVFRRKNADTEYAAAVYSATAKRARTPELFEVCGIPDTLDGRFDALALHAALTIDRLHREPDGTALAQAFFDAMFRHLDLTLREIGVQDLGVGRRIKIMAEGFQG